MNDPASSGVPERSLLHTLTAQLHAFVLFMQGPVDLLTDGSLADVVYTANIPLLGILANADPRGAHRFLQTAIKAATEVLARNDTSGLFMRHTVEVRTSRVARGHGNCLHHRGEGTRSSTGMRAPEREECLFLRCWEGTAPAPCSSGAKSRREVFRVALIAGGGGGGGPSCEGGPSESDVQGHQERSVLKD